MSKRFYRFSVILAVFCGIFALAVASHAMMKSTGIVRKTGDALGSVIVERDDGNNWFVEWSYDNRFNNKSLAGTKVNINLYQNGKFLYTIAKDVSIGQNSHGSWRGTWRDFSKNASQCSWDWGAKNKANGPWGKDYQIEIAISTESNLRAMGGKFVIE